MTVNCTVPPPAYLPLLPSSGQGKVQPSLSTPYRCKWGVHVQVHAFLTLESDGGKWLASCTRCYMAQTESQYPQNRIGGPQSQCGQCEEEKNLLTPDRTQAIDNSACTICNYLIKHKVEVVSVQATKACGAGEVPLHSFLTSELDQGE